VGGQYELDRQIEQRTETSSEVVARHVLATAELDVEPVAEVRERVGGDDRIGSTTARGGRTCIGRLYLVYIPSMFALRSLR
jgi:hypothetical protein